MAELEPMSVFGTNAQLDAQVRSTLASKTFLSRILARTMSELKGLSFAEVAACIEGEPEVASVNVAPGRTSADRITGTGAEDAVPGEGAVRYDIRTFVNVPGESGPVRVIVNVEAQKKYHPGYSIVTRAVYYAARLISAQLGTEFEHSDYDSIKKVYSIWVCMDAPKATGNAIAAYSFSKRDLLGSLPDEPAAYDKAEVVIIALDGEPGAGDELTGMLNLLLSPAVSEEEKVRRLEDEYNMELTDDDAKGVSEMCNMSGYVEEYGNRRGREEQMAELVVDNLRRGKKPEEIAEWFSISVEQVREIERKALAPA